MGNLGLEDRGVGFGSGAGGGVGAEHRQLAPLDVPQPEPRGQRFYDKCNSWQ